MVDFKSQYAYDLTRINNILNSDVATKEQKENAEGWLPLIEELIKIEPFPAYYDEKYGFLVKRKVSFNRIVMDMPQNPLYIYAREVADNVKLIKESTKHTEDFKQQVIAEALHPDRVEYLINKHGIEDGMSTYD